jgi:sodium transport system permease protein
LGNKWWAIGLSAVFFGMAHSIIQQSLAAAAVGMLLGYIAVQTGSLIPCVLFHMTYNSVMLLMSHLPATWQEHPVVSQLLYEPAPGQIAYVWPVVALSCLAAAPLVLWLHRLGYEPTREEQISDARARQLHQPVHQM